MTAPTVISSPPRPGEPGSALPGRGLRPAAVYRAVVAAVLVAVAGLVFLALAPRLVGIRDMWSSPARWSRGSRPATWC